MRKAAEYGRGTHVHIGAQDQIAERMTQLLEKLERPALTGIEARWPQAGPSATIEAFPRTVPDLYHGEPVVLVARIEGAGDGPLPTFVGRVGDMVWTTGFTAADVHPAEGIAALWARSKVEALMDTLHDGVPIEAVRAAVIQTALRHNLTSRFTSLVAVEHERSRPEGAPSVAGQVPHNLPNGWDYEKVFGDRLLRRAGPVQRDASLGKAEPSSQSARRGSPAAGSPTALAAAPAAAGQAVALPQGGTSGPIDLLVGMALLLIGAGAWIARRYA
jgi:Ca-activated chloride channel family protein